VESKRSGVHGSSNWAKESGNAEGKGRGSTKLAGTQKCQRSAKVFRPCYHRRFIKDFSRIAALLHALVRKEQKWKWEKEQEEVFERLKTVFTTEPILAIPDIDREMRVEANASDYTTGGVLLTKCEDGKWRPVAFISKSLNATE